MKKITLSVAFSVLFLYACNLIVDCDDCFTPPETYFINLVDKTTGENLFAQGQYNTKHVKLINSEGTEIELMFLPSENTDTIIACQTLGWESLLRFNFTLQLSPTQNIALNVKTRAITEDCCTYHQTEYFKANNQKIEKSTTDKPVNQLLVKCYQIEVL